MRIAASSVALCALGAGGLAAWQHGMWGTVLGVALSSVWIALHLAWRRDRPRTHAETPSESTDEAGSVSLYLLLDQLPVPLVNVRETMVCALNRAARTLFETDDRILPPPASLTEHRSSRMLYRNRRFRIDRLETKEGVIAALIDVDIEERAAEARASADMIQVFGHEMLNGLAPIVSLAESGLAAIEAPASRDELLPEILGTLARRAEGLLRFTEAYRTLARLPEPVCVPTSLDALATDLTRLFDSRWRGRVALDIVHEGETVASLDRDQVTQALWALMQNVAEAAILADGKARVQLRMVAGADLLAIDITDTGSGIGAPDSARIFRPFHTTKTDGTGVGLSLARQIALAHEGDLKLRQNKPASFRMEIPLAS